MSKFKYNPTQGRCHLCGRLGRGHCTVSYPNEPKKLVGNNKRLRVCKDCALLTITVIDEKEDFHRNIKVEKKLHVLVKERKDKRKKRK